MRSLFFFFITLCMALPLQGAFANDTTAKMIKITKAHPNSPQTLPPSDTIPSSDTIPPSDTIKEIKLSLSDGSPLMKWKEVSEEDIQIFRVDLNNYILSEGLILYEEKGKYFISLSGMLDALEFPINIDINKATAEGWFLNDDRQFFLNMRLGAVQIMGKRYALDPKKIHRQADDFYVEVSEFSKWFPVLLDLDFQNQTVKVKSLEALPIEERIAKRARRGKIKNSKDHYKDYIPEKDQIPFISRPFADVNINIKKDSKQTNISSRYSINATAIMLGQDTELNIYGQDIAKKPSMRITMGRKSNTADLLGPLNLRAYSFGDVYSPNIPLVSQNVTGRGILLSSYELDRISNSRNATLRGELPSGWEAELYRNGSLLSFQVNSTNGQYEFSNVKTLPGLNVFKLIFYGPQGQTREKFIRIYSDGDVIEAGASNFRFAMNQKLKNLIFSDADLAAREDFGTTRIQAMGEYGLLKNLTLVGSFSNLTYKKQQQQYYQLGLRSNLGGLSSSLDLSFDGKNGYAFLAAADARFGRYSLSAEHQQFSNYISETTKAAKLHGNLKNKTSLTLNGTLPFIKNSNIPFNLGAEYLENTTGENSKAIFGRLSKNIGRYALSWENRWVNITSGQNEWQGSILASTLIGSTRFRGIVSYKVSPETKISQVQLNSNWHLGYNTGLAVNLSYHNQSEEFGSIDLGIHKDFEEFKLNAKINLNTQGDFYAGVGISFGIGLEPRRSDLHMSKRPYARTGMISPRVFLDRDNNMVFSEGDELLEDVHFSSNYSTGYKKTDEFGKTLITGMPLYKTIYLSVDEGTLQNPYLIPRQKGVSFELRPGYPHQIDFIIQESGEIDGTLTRMIKGRKSVASGILLILKNEDGSIFTQVTSGYDGFYIISKIPPGKYSLEFDNNQLAMLGYKSVPARDILIEGEESMLYGLDYILQVEGVNEEIILAEAKEEARKLNPTGREEISYGIHLMSFIHQESIQLGWNAMSMAYPEEFRDRPVRLIPFEWDRTYIRMIVGTYKTPEAALESCRTFHKDAVYCRVLPFKGTEWKPETFKEIQ